MLKPRIAVDLTPMLLGGANGGAKWATIDLLNGLAGREMRLVCFCRSASHGELRALLADEIVLVEVAEGTDVRLIAKQWNTAAEPIDLAFFPFHRVSFSFTNVPTVSVLHDIQFRDMPQNFAQQELAEREQSLQNGLGGADRIITISNFVRSSIVQHTAFLKSRIDVSYILTRDALSPNRRSREEEQAVLDRYGLESGKYIIYPANFWEHKNHRTLIAAYLLYLRRTANPMMLVFTGDLESPLGKEICRLAEGLAGDHIVVTGFVSTEEVQALLANARAMVFPSLYEGFGMPLVEAMALGVPIAASWATCIPEVAGEAALLFDPQQPRRICDALRTITEDEAVRARLIAAARGRLDALGGRQRMIDQYVDSFEKALTAQRPNRDNAQEVTSDGWIGDAATFTAGVRKEPQRLEISLEVPSFAPLVTEVEIESTVVGTHRFTVGRGSRYLLSEAFPPAGGSLTVRPVWTFVPERDLNAKGDYRTLSLRCETVLIRHGVVTTTLIGQGEAEAPVDGFGVVIAMVGATASARNRVVIGGAGLLAPSQVEFELSGIPDIAVCAPAEGGAEPAEQRIAKPDGPDGAVQITLTDLRSNQVFDAEGELSPRIDVRRAEASRNGEPVPVLVSRSKPIGAPATIRAVPAMASGFSVITPSFNQGEFIGRTFESVLTQRRIADYHVFDALSTDSTRGEAARFGERITFTSERDAGQADAVNKGLLAGRGEYIAWINSDDTYAPDAFDHVAEIFDSRPDVGVVYGEAFHIDTDDQVIDRYPTEDFRLTRLIETCFLCQPATFFRREAVERVGGLRADLQYCMDYELWLRMAIGGVKFHRTNTFLANSRLYETNKTAGARVNVHQEVNDMMTQCFRVSPDKWLNAFSRILVEERLDVSELEAREMQASIRHIGEIFWRHPLDTDEEIRPAPAEAVRPDRRLIRWLMRTLQSPAVREPCQDGALT